MKKQKQKAYNNKAIQGYSFLFGLSDEDFETQFKNRANYNWLLSERKIALKNIEINKPRIDKILESYRIAKKKSKVFLVAPFAEVDIEKVDFNGLPFHKMKIKYLMNVSGKSQFEETSLNYKQGEIHTAICEADFIDKDGNLKYAFMDEKFVIITDRELHLG